MYVKSYICMYVCMYTYNKGFNFESAISEPLKYHLYLSFLICVHTIFCFRIYKQHFLLQNTNTNTHS